MSWEIRRIWINGNLQQRELWEGLLHACGIHREEHLDYTVGVYEGECLLATGSLYGNIIKCVAVDPQYQGTGVINGLISHLLDRVFSLGHSSCFIYTKPEAASSFFHLGFQEIARVEGKLVFGEKAIYGFDHYLRQLKRYRLPGERIAGIVMNANPFTKGHQHLVETATRENEVVHLFVLSEELSAFPAAVRRQLVKEGTSHLKNVYVHETGDYMVSSKTFPSYFLKEEANVTQVQAQLDAVIFKEHIAPALGITRRYVGEEPFSFATQIYNKAMAQVFAGSLELIVIPRKAMGDQVISATRVRALMAAGKIDELESLVPEGTFRFIQSPAGVQIQEKLRQEGSQHGKI